EEEHAPPSPPPRSREQEEAVPSSAPAEPANQEQAEPSTSVPPEAGTGAGLGGTYADNHLRKPTRAGRRKGFGAIKEITRELLVAFRDPGHVAIQLFMDYERNDCGGEVEGLAEVTEGKGVFRGEQGCVLTLAFHGDAVEISEQSCSYYHGAACEFSG